MAIPRFPDAPGRSIPVETRRAILPENGAVVPCVYCGAEATSIDHIYPWGQGGTHDRHNLVPACEVCNSIAGIRVFGELAEKRIYILARRADLGRDAVVAAYDRVASGGRPRIE